MDRRRERYLSIVLVFLVPFAVYSLTGSSGYILDDKLQVLQNPWITDVSYIYDIFLSSVWSFQDTAIKTNYYRPVMHLIFMGEYHLFGLDPAGFHLVNAFIHSLNTVLVFLVVSTLFASNGSGVFGAAGGAGGALAGPKSRAERKLWMPVAAALLFALHPVNSEAVAWISSVPELSYTFFFLIAFYLYIKISPEQGTRSSIFFYALSTLCFFLALLCKETAMTLLLFIWAYDHLKTGRRTFRRYFVYLPYIFAALFYMALRVNALGNMTQHKVADLTIFESVLYAFPLIMRYFGKLLYPGGLTTIYALNPVRSIFEFLFIAGFLFTLGLIAVIATLYIRKRQPGLLFSLLWIVFPLMPVMYVPLVSLGGFGDRYLYLSTAGFAMIAVLLLSKCLSLVSLRAKGGRFLVNAARAAVLIVLLIYAVATVSRIYVWSSEFSFWSDVTAKTPTSPIANSNLGVAYQERGELDKSIEYFKIAIELAPGNYKGFNNLGNSYLLQGRYKISMVNYKKALELNFNNVETHYNLGVLYERMGYSGKAAGEFKEALRLDPDLKLARVALSRVSGH